MTDLEQILIISLLPVLFYVILSIFSSDDGLDDSFKKYMIDQNNKKRLLKPRKRGKK